MKKRKTYRAPDLYLHRVARLHLLANTVTLDASSEGVTPVDEDLFQDPDASTEGVGFIGNLWE